MGDKDIELRKLKTIIHGAIRRTFSRSSIVKECLKGALHPTKKGIRGGKQYICASCKKTFGGNKVQVDHIIPVTDLDRTIANYSYDEMVERIYVTPDKLQVLCIECHKDKSNKEREERADLRFEKKFYEEIYALKVNMMLNNDSPLCPVYVDDNEWWSLLFSYRESLKVKKK